MSKLSLINREKKRLILINKFYKIRLFLKKIINNKYLKFNKRYKARLKLQNLPRNSSFIRKRNRCFITGRARGVFRKFKLSRIKIREMFMNGEIPGMIKSSW